jgi:hypothetical protein
MDFVVSMLIPLAGAISCVRVFPMSMRKFSTIIMLWIFLIVCSSLMRFLPFFMPGFFAEVLTERTPLFVSTMLTTIGVLGGMLLLPLTYFLMTRFRKF